MRRLVLAQRARAAIRALLATSLASATSCGGAATDPFVDVPGPDSTPSHSESEGLIDSGPSSSASGGEPGTNDGADEQADEQGEGEDEFPEDCGGAHLALHAPPSGLVWLVDNSFGSTIGFDHDDDPTSAQVTAQARIATLMNSLVQSYPGNNGCDVVEPRIVFFPGPETLAPPAEQSCEPGPLPPDAHPRTKAQVIADWQTRPDPSGAAPLYAAYAQLVDQLVEASDNDFQQIVVLSASPGGCGPDSESLGPRIGQLALESWWEHSIRTQVVIAGPESGSHPSAIDGLPDGVDLGQVWDYERDYYDLQTFTPDEGPALLDALRTPDSSGESVYTCYFDLTTPPNTPPEPGMTIPRVFINQETFYALDISLQACLAADAPTGFIWDEAGHGIQLCGGACLATRCEQLPPYPNNDLVIDVPYVCPT